MFRSFGETDMVIKHNMMVENAGRMLYGVTTGKKKSTERLSSGYKINRAADDAAGLAVSEKMRRQIRGLTQASENAQDGISLLQVADGALTEVHDMLQRINELSVQAANGTNNTEDRAAINQEITQLKEEIDRIGDTTSFNEHLIFKGNVLMVPTIAISLPDYPSEDAIIADNHVNESGNGWRSISTPAQNTFIIDGNKDFVIKNYQTNPQDVDIPQSGCVLLDNLKLSSLRIGSSVESVIVNDNVDIINGGSIYNNYGATVYIKSQNDKNLIFFNTAGNSHTIVDGNIEAQSFHLENGNIESINGASIHIKEYVNEIMHDPTGFVIEGNNKLVNTSLYVDTDPRGLRFVNNPSFTVSGEVTIGGKQAKNLECKFIVEEGIFTCPQELINRGLVEYDEDKFNLSINNGQATVMSKSWSDVLINHYNFFLQVGSEAGNKIGIELEDMNTHVLGISGLNCLTESSASDAIGKVSDAIEHISRMRSKFGAYQNRLEHTINNLNNVVENTTAAESRIRDTDMALTMVDYSKQNILEQAGLSVLSQANQEADNVLSLLQ